MFLFLSICLMISTESTRYQLESIFSTAAVYFDQHIRTFVVATLLLAFACHFLSRNGHRTFEVIATLVAACVATCVSLASYFLPEFQLPFRSSFDSVSTSFPTWLTPQLIVALVLMVCMKIALRSIYHAAFYSSVVQNSIPTPPFIPIGESQETGTGNYFVDIATKYRKQYGGVFNFIPGVGFHCVVISDATLLKEVIQSKHVGKSPASYFAYLDMLSGGMVVIEGEKWKFHRQIITPLFRFSWLESVVFGIFTRIISHEADELEASITANGEEGSLSVDLMHIFRRMTLKIITATVFGMDPFSESFETDIETFVEIYSCVITEINHRVYHPYRKYLPTQSNRTYSTKLSQLDAMILRRIRDKRSEFETTGQHTEQRDLLSSLILNKTAQGEMFTDQDILSEIKTFLLAGHETSSMWLAYAVFFLSLPQNAENYSCISRECDQANGLLLQDLKELKCTTNALKETLRLMPVVPLLIKKVVSQSGIQLGENKAFLPCGTHIILDIWGAQHDPKVWGNDAEDFNLHRFEDFPSSSQSAYSYLPFGIGSRSCIGQNFAMLEAKVAMVVFMSRFEFKPTSKGLSKLHRYDIPLHPRDGIPMLVKRKKC